MNSNQQVIIELKSGTKCEGVLVSIDKEKMLIKLSNAKRTLQGEDGKPKEESFANLEIAKDEIKEVKIVQFEPSANQETKKSEPSQSANLNAIPQNLQNNALTTNDNQIKTYDKTDSFFDALTPMTNKDAQYESIRYNDKNCETFDLPPGSGNYDGSSSYGNRRGGQRRGGYRGGYSRGGYNNNNYRNNNYNNNGGYGENNGYPNNNFNNGNSSYQNPNNNSNFYGNQGGSGYPNNNYNANNGSNYGGSYRGGRGGYQNYNNNNRRNNYQNNNSNYNPNYNNNNFPNNSNSDNFSNYSNQFQKQAQMFGANNTPNFPINSSGMQQQQQNFEANNSGNFGNNNFHRGGRGGSRGFSGSNYRGGRGGNRNYNNNTNNANRIPNPEFNSINESNDVNDQLDDDYSMSIYDKASSSEAFASQKPNTQNLSAYDPNPGKN